ncbi:MAG TPA: T9SS type A sorting domain-containing protein [Candidatus Kapabacteria bacterium]|nr:T9SS type A sorting domain-containing protein [Candidatus Kapabacteria bacterium]
MKKLLLILAGFGMTTAASAQTVDIYSAGQHATAWKPSGLPIVAPTAAPSEATAPAAQLTTLRNYDPDVTAVALPATPGVHSGFNVAFVGFSQQFILPASTGFLDTLKVRFQAVGGDKLQILVFQDTLVESQGFTFHSMNYTPWGFIGGIELNLAGLTSLQDFTVNFPMGHLALPERFHVLIGANQVTGNNYSSQFSILAEPHTDRTAPSLATTTNALLTADFTAFSPAPLDGFFALAGENIGVDLWIDAVVDLEAALVDRVATTPAAMYPNPVSASNMLKIEHNEMISSVRVVNMLGNEVLGWDGMRKVVELSAAGLAKGVYHVIVNTENGMTTEKLIVE